MAALAQGGGNEGFRGGPMRTMADWSHSWTQSVMSLDASPNSNTASGAKSLLFSRLLFPPLSNRATSQLTIQER